MVNIDPARLRRRATKYAVAVSDLYVLIEHTGGHCMVCRQCHASIIEHCHETGHVRGIVCGWCNGRLRDVEPTKPIPEAGRRSCGCLDFKSGGHADLWRSAYLYIEHAADLFHLPVAEAFAALAANPFPPAPITATTKA
jgi:hypothetical protein